MSAWLRWDTWTEAAAELQAAAIVVYSYATGGFDR